MKTLQALAALVLVSVASPDASAQSWRWLQPALGASTLKDVVFADAQRGFAVGERGAVLRTTNGGTSWDVRPTPDFFALSLDAVTANGQTMVAVGGTEIIRSVDGGTTLERVEPGISASFVDVQLLSQTQGFALDANAQLYQSTDGFRTMTKRARITFGQATAMWFMSATRGWVVGRDAAGTGGWIARTNDGGQSFVRDFTSPILFSAVNGITFNGVAAVIATGSGSPQIASLNEFENKPWENGPFIGGNYTAISLMVPGPDQGEFWLAGQDGVIGGRFNQDAVQFPMNQTRPRMWGVASPVFGTAFAVGEGGTIARITFGSTQPTIVNGNRKETYVAGSFPTADGGAGVLADNQPGVPRVWLTTNGAATLTPAQVAPSDILDLSFVDAQNGFGLLSNGELYASANGGQTGIRRATLNFGAQAIAFQSATQGYAGGSGGLFRTSDGGANWTQIFSSSSVSQLLGLIDVSIAGSVAYALDSRGVVWRRQGSAIDSPWLELQGASVPGAVSISAGSDGTVLVGGRLVMLFDANGGRRFTSQFGENARSVANIDGRWFALYDGGTITEIDSTGGFRSTFRARADLRALVVRRTASMPGNGGVSPLAIGNFGALLAFNDTVVPNQPPKVSGPPLVELPFPGDAQVTVVASDPEGQPLTYSWASGTGAPLKIDITSSPTPRIAWTQPVPAGTTAVLTVKVCDPQLACTVFDIKVLAKVQAPNQLPTVFVSPPSVTLPSTGSATLNARAFDPDGDPITFSWATVSSAALVLFTPSNAPTTTIKWAQPVPAGTRARLQLEVCDNRGGCTQAFVDVVASAVGPNRPPVAVASGISVKNGDIGVIDGSQSSDPDGDQLSYQWNQLSGPSARLVSPPNTPVMILEAPSTSTVLTFELRVCDPQGLCGRIEVLVVVLAPNTNAPPVAQTTADLEVAENDAVLLDASRSQDPEDGPRVTYSWFQASGPARTITNGTQAVAQIKAGPLGEQYRFTVKVCDRQAACAEASLNVKVVRGGPPPPNRPPVINAVSPSQANAGDRITLKADVTDPDGDVVTVKFSEDNPGRGLQIRPTGPTTAEVDLPANLAAGEQVNFVTIACDSRGLCSQPLSSPRVLIIGTSQRVVAQAGPDREAKEGEEVVLDGSASSGNIRSHQWNQDAGTSVFLKDLGNYRASFIAPAGPAELKFRLVIFGADGSQSTDDVTIRIGGAQGPVAKAGDDQVVAPGARVQLDGRGSSDAAGRTLTFQWTLAPPVTLAGADAAVASFVAPGTEGTIECKLTVCAGTLCASDTVTIQVRRGSNLAPLANAGFDRTATSGDVVALDGSRSLDPEDDPISYQWKQIGGESARIASAGAAWTPVQIPAVTAAQTLTFELTVCDDRRSCATDTVDVRVLPRGGGAPVVTVSVEGGDGTRVGEGKAFSVKVEARCEGLCKEPYDVRVLAGPPIERLSTGPYAFQAPRVSRPLPFVIEAVVCDTAGRCSVATLDGLVTDDINEPPYIVLESEQVAKRHQRVVLDAARTYDPNGDGITFGWKKLSGPAEVELSGLDVPRPRWTVPPNAPTGAYVFEVTVCDSRGACETAETTVNVEFGAGENRPPVAFAGDDRSIPQDLSVVLDATASFDPDGDSLTYRWVVISGGETAVLTDAEAARALITSAATTGEPITIRLQVCDAQRACSTDDVLVNVYASLPPEPSGVGALETDPGCTCGGANPAMALLVVLAPLLRRRKR